MNADIRRCYRAIRRGSKSFALASHFLPRQARDRAVAIYAWCRRTDDAIDLIPRDEQLQSLQHRRAELDRVYAGLALDDPTLATFQRVVLECDIPRSYPEDLLDGMEMDVSGTLYDTTEALLQYCYCVAGTVGLMMCHAMGVKDESAMRNAAHMGMAMQLTNICRDVAEDWDLGRLYIPRSLLGLLGVPDLATRLGGPFPETRKAQVAGATELLLQEADRYYTSGDAGLAALSPRCALAIRTARHVYSSIGRRIRRAECDPLAGRAVVPLRQKLVLTAVAMAITTVDLFGRGSRLRTERPATPAGQVTFPDDVLPV